MPIAQIIVALYDQIAMLANVVISDQISVGSSNILPEVVL
jgi:hypothetical protein